MSIDEKTLIAEIERWLFVDQNRCVNKADLIRMIQKQPNEQPVSSSYISDDILEAVINEHDMNIPDDLLVSPGGFGAHRGAMKAALEKIIPLTMHIELEYREARKRESGGWVSMRTSPPENGECLIWLKPVNGNGEAHWSIRKGRFWNGTFSEWGGIDDYKPEVYSRITHWHPNLKTPLTNEIEDHKPSTAAPCNPTKE